MGIAGAALHPGSPSGSPGAGPSAFCAQAEAVASAAPEAASPAIASRRVGSVRLTRLLRRLDHAAQDARARAADGLGELIVRVGVHHEGRTIVVQKGRRVRRAVE